MRIRSTFALAMLAVSFAAIGCNPEPIRVEPVAESVLPAEARAALAPGATITTVEQQTFKGDVVIYRVTYELDGKTYTQDINTKRTSGAYGVFE